MGAPLDPLPYRDALIDDGRSMTARWIRSLYALWARVISCVAVVGSTISTGLTNQSATIATTTLYTVSVNGVYRISTYLRVTVADGVSSSAQITVGWREGSQTCSKTFANVNGDTVTSFDSNTWVVRADSGTVITYAVAYASNTPAKMRFRFDAIVELVN